jgi:pimeloyl-ACP methyl ester carboxylesterase/DNA-binding CsgD family transcriptional regulator
MQQRGFALYPKLATSAALWQSLGLSRPGAAPQDRRMPTLPATSFFARTCNGQRLAATRSGQGPTVIQVPGWVSHQEHDAASPMAGPLVQALAAQHRVLRYDARGCGLSDVLHTQVGLEHWLQDLEAVAHTAGPARFALLGISQGAAVAIAYAARHPERVSRLVLHGGYARGGLVREHSAAAAEEAHTLARLAEIGWGRADPAFRQLFTTQLIPGGSRQQHAQFNEMQRHATRPDMAAALMRAFDRVDVSALLAQVRCPVLVLHSRHDRRVPLDEGRHLAAALRDAEFVSLDSRNHLLLDTEPAWPRWLAQVQHFLAHDSAEHNQALVAALLTERQRDLIEMVAQGLDNGQIAAQLALSEKTVRNHITNIFDRLGVENRGRAIVRLRESGFGGARA